MGSSEQGTRWDCTEHTCTRLALYLGFNIKQLGQVVLEAVQRVGEEEEAQTHYLVTLLKIREIPVSLSDKIIAT